MESIKSKIEKKGVTKSHVARMVKIHISTLSRIMSGKQSHTSDELIQKIHTYLDSINTDDKDILK